MAMPTCLSVPEKSNDKFEPLTFKVKHIFTGLDVFSRESSSRKSSK